MRKIFLTAVIIVPLFSLAQFGIKAGVNFANVTNASEINSGSESGFMAGIFLAPPSTGVMGFRTELIFSRQGYSYKTNTNTGVVNLDYILLPQLMQINITKFFSIQLGAQMAFLINAKADSSTSSGGSSPYGEIMDFYNKFDYGFAGGIEIHPFKGLLVGARYNISLGNLYKDPSSYEMNGGQPPSFIPAVDVKNNVLQIFAGWIFGNNSSKKKQQTQPQQ
ncbi:MAG TPA: porin family protein [Chitinophagaceae bacterium]|nr:porin family protein [Chitinophagaceae bacterium]